MYPGLTRKLTTADNADMTVSYGTSADVGIEDETHTGTQVRIAAYGPRAANVVGLTDQTDLFFTMTDALGIKRRSHGRARPQRAGEEHVDPLHRNAVRPPRRPLEQVQRTDVG